MTAIEKAAIDAAESAVCPCGHIALDHAWHGCEECACGRSGIAAFLTSETNSTTAARAIADQAAADLLRDGEREAAS